MTAHCRRKRKETSLEAIRIGAVRRVLAGENADTVIRGLGFSRGCIYEWLRKYRLGGWAALKTRRITGRPHRLTEVQQAVVYQALVQENPLRLGLGSALWTRAMLAAFIRQRFQVHLSRASVGRLLQEFGLVTQRPWHRAYEENPGAMERWLNKDYKQIRLLARHARAEIVFLDIAPTQCGICDKESCSARPATAARASTGRRLISAVNPRGQIRFMVVDGRCDVPSGGFPPLRSSRGDEARTSRKSEPPHVGCHDAETGFHLRDFLQRLMQGRTRPLFLVVPDDPASHERVVRECVATFQGRLRLFVGPSEEAKATATDLQPGSQPIDRPLESLVVLPPRPVAQPGAASL